MINRKFLKDDRNKLKISTWKNIEKRIYRQRLIIEGKYTRSLNPAILRRFLKDLSDHIGMTIIYGPIVRNLAGRINPIHGGYESIIIWAESGVQLYTWKKFKFFTLDIYTCKKFDVQSVITFVKKNLQAKTIVWKEI